ncbi:MAG: hypothetical protein AAGD38_08335 [Acidobacteriota bacterium]
MRVGGKLIVGRTGTVVDEGFTTIGFGQPVIKPTFLAAMQTMNDSDPATIRFTNLSIMSVRVQIDEEQSEDSETNHGNEMVGYVVIGN